MALTSKHPETLALHAGWRADATTGSVAVPIHQTTSYQFHSPEHAANLFALKEFGNIYTRIMNPTTDVLEQRLAAVEGGVAALAVASGQAASAFSVQNLARAGDNIVASTDLYGGTWNLFANTLKDQGLEVRFVDPADPHAFANATDTRTRAYYAETLPNPKLRLFPIEEVASIGRKQGIPLIMDNTAAPLAGAPVRAWRRGGNVFHHEISRRPRHQHRRRAHRWGEFRLVSLARAPAFAQHSRPQLSRRRLGRSGQTSGPHRLYHPRPRRASARPRRGTVPLQCVPAHPGHRNIASPHRPAQRECRSGGKIPL